MTDEAIVAWKVGADEMEIDLMLDNNQKTVSNESISGKLEHLKVPKKEEENIYEIPEKESVFRVNSAASYGSIGSVGSFEGDEEGDERGDLMMRKKSKKMSICSTFSNLSGQPYISMMSNVSRDRKLSSTSSDTSGGSLRTRKISEGIPAFISMMAQNDSTADESLHNENLQDQSWVAQNQLYGNGKKIYFKNFHGREKMRKRGEIFPGYEKTIQERAANSEDKTEDDFLEEDEHQVCERVKVFNSKLRCPV